MSAADDAAAASAALASAGAAGIKSGTVDGLTTEMYPLPDLIAADQYLAGKAAANSRTRGLRFNRLVPDGTVHRHARPDSTEWRDV